MLRPEWAAPPGVRAGMTTREGGVSQGPFASLNLSASVGDAPEAVAQNRRRVQAAWGLPFFTPHLVHGAAVVRISAASLQEPRPQADACWSTDPSLACAVTAADCLPVLFSTADGRAVAAAHAGWRGLAAGVLEHTVQALCQGTGCAAAELHAWLGPCIGPKHFEVGPDVLLAFGADRSNPPPAFIPRGDRWLANLPALAQERLQRAGLRQVSGDASCTYAEPSRFFSFRRDRVTGRMLAAIACRV
jgi:polyphenol oxidase